MDIYLIRHTTPAIEKGIIYGQTDIDVTPDFEKEATAIQQNIPTDTDAVYSSPLQRCTKLAQFLFNKDVIEDSRLQELNFGDWEGLMWGDVEEKQLNNWMENFVTTAPPNGESMADMLKRVQGFWTELLKLNHSKVVVITHAGVIRLISSIIMDTGLKDIFDLKIEYGDVFKVDSVLKKWETVS